MAFDLKKFQKAKLEPRTESVPVPALADFYDGDPVWVVRGLTGEEMARVNEAQTKARNLTAVVEALAGNGHKEKVEALRESLGLAEDSLPVDLARRIEMLALGSVDPVIDQQAAAKLFRAHPVIGYDLTNRITALSGQGAILGESPGSGRKKRSEPRSPSDTSTASASTN